MAGRLSVCVHRPWARARGPTRVHPGLRLVRDKQPDRRVPLELLVRVSIMLEEQRQDGLLNFDVVAEQFVDDGLQGRDKDWLDARRAVTVQRQVVVVLAVFVAHQLLDQLLLLVGSLVAVLEDLGDALDAQTHGAVCPLARGPLGEARLDLAYGRLRPARRAALTRRRRRILPTAGLGRVACSTHLHRAEIGEGAGTRLRMVGQARHGTGRGRRRGGLGSARAAPPHGSFALQLLPQRLELGADYLRHRTCLMRGFQLR